MKHNVILPASFTWLCIAMPAYSLPGICSPLEWVTRLYWPSSVLTPCYTHRFLLAITETFFLFYHPRILWRASCLPASLFKSPRNWDRLDDTISLLLHVLPATAPPLVLLCLVRLPLYHPLDTLSSDGQHGTAGCEQRSTAATGTRLHSTPGPPSPLPAQPLSFKGSLLFLDH